MTADGTALRARPTNYNGISMRSRLEARVAAWLDSLGIVWLYEPEAFASPAGQYLPDFELLPDPSVFGTLTRRVFLEVKGRLDYDDAVALMGRMASIVGASEPRAFLLVSDEEMLESGIVHAYNFPFLSAWLAVDAVPLFVSAAVLPMPAHWRLPAWGKQ